MTKMNSIKRSRRVVLTLLAISFVIFISGFKLETFGSLSPSNYGKMYYNLYGSSSSYFFIQINVAEYELSICSKDTLNFKSEFILKTEVWNEKHQIYDQVEVKKSVPPRVLLDIYRICEKRDAYRLFYKDNHRTPRKMLSCWNTWIYVKIKYPKLSLLEYGGDFCDAPSEIYQLMGEIKQELKEHSLLDK